MIFTRFNINAYNMIFFIFFVIAAIFSIVSMSRIFKIKSKFNIECDYMNMSKFKEELRNPINRLAYNYYKKSIRISYLGFAIFILGIVLDILLKK